MAITVANITTATSTTSSSTLATTASVTAAAGTWLYVALACDNNGTNGDPSVATNSISDSASNTWTNRVLLNNDPGAAAAGITLAIWTCEVTNALTNGTITISFSPNTTSKTFVVQRLTPGSGEKVVYVDTGAGATGSSNAPTINSTSVAADDVIFGAIAIEGNDTITGDSDTSNGTWSTQYTQVANTGTVLTSVRIATQYKAVTSTSSQTYNVSYTTARDYAINWVEFGTEPLTVTTTKTTTGNARLQKTVSATRTGKSRITISETKTRAGRARLQKTLSNALTGTSKVRPATDPTYSRGVYESLPTGIDTLSVLYTESDYLKAAATDNDYVQLFGVGYLIHQFKIYSASSSPLTVSWVGRSIRPCSLSPCYLQVYNHSTLEWDTITSNSSFTGSTNFELSETVEDPAPYQDTYQFITVRVWQQV